MKLLLENWRKYLNEAEGEFQIFCDMDGVLADFVTPVLEVINKDLKDMSIPDRKPTGGMTRMGKLRKALKEAGVDEITLTHIGKSEGKIRHAISYMIKRVGDDEKFWANLPKMPDADRLWEFIKPYNPILLTTPQQPGSEEGKRVWAEKHLGITPNKVFMAPNPPGKSGWAKPNAILIDDFYQTNVVPWRQAGGIGIYHKNAADTIRKLKGFGFVDDKKGQKS